eukprot:PhF_6_TR30546/c0_g1_i1/m.44836
MDLLRPFRAVITYFQYPFLDTDSFNQRCRKCICTLLLILVFPTIALLLSRVNKYKTLEGSVIFAMYIDSILYVFLFPGLYFWMRYHRTASDNFTQFMGYSILAIFWYRPIRDVSSATTILVALLIIGAVVAQMPRIKVFCATALPAIGLHYYNLVAVTKERTSAANHASHPPFMMNEPWGDHTHCNTLDEVNVTLGFIMHASMIWIVYMQTQAFNKQLLMAQSNTNIACRVSELLEEYRTEEAISTIREDGAGCDVSLLESLGTIVKNMEAYRPYLPNYLLQKVPSTKDDDDDSATTESITSVFSSRGGGDITIPPAQGSFILQESTLHTRPVTVARLTYGDLFLNEEISTIEPSRLRSSVVHFVETVHMYASEHGAAVHSFLGDEMWMSWNATTRCVDHYYRGAVVATGLRTKFVEESEGIHLHGALVSGLMRCQRGGTKTFAWTLHGPTLFWEINAVHRIAMNVKECILTTSALMEQIEHSARSQAIDAIRVPQKFHPNDVVEFNKNTEHLCVVHELVEVISPGLHDDKDSEWMYRIQQQGKGISSQVSDCVQLGVSGQALEALSALESILQQNSSEITNGTRHLLRRLKECVSGHSTMPYEN